MNMQPSEAEAGFDVRLPTTVDPELFRKKIADEWAPLTRNMTYKVRTSPDFGLQVITDLSYF